MRHQLEFRRTYRATVRVPLILQKLCPPELIAEQMKLYQLYGSVAANGETYIVTAQFRGRSGNYELPGEVQSVEMIA